ncbi:MAG: RNA methyltransferase [Flavobacterium sp.]|nr:RNA methyltransferase [Flavobacterium sp.]
MITKNQIKLIISLQQKKNRLEHKLFIAEGEKVIRELLNSEFELSQIFYSEPIFNDLKSDKQLLISHGDLKKISALTTPNNCLALFKIPLTKPIVSNELIVVLDDIRDPGNLGTIIRLCDWYGVLQIVCSPETVDVYNPKVVQATMGSLKRVQINYTLLEEYLRHCELPVFGTFMDGENIYKTKLPKKAVIIMGNEANGISEKLEQFISKKISIPRFGAIQKTESLNVASATAIILSEFLRDF